MSAPAVATTATGLGLLLLGVGIALWARARFAEVVARARPRIDRAVLESLLGGPRFCHALADEVGGAETGGGRHGGPPPPAADDSPDGADRG